MNEQKPGFPIMEIDDFLRFFYSDAKANNMKMASAPDMDDSRNDLAMSLFGKTLDLLSEEELEILNEETQRLMQKFMGIEAKLAQYQAGEDFIAAIEAERGDNAVDLIWQSAEHLPSMDEIRNPSAWMQRVPVGI